MQDPPPRRSVSLHPNPRTNKTKQDFPGAFLGMSPSVVTISPFEESSTRKLRNSLKDSWASSHAETESILNEFVRNQLFSDHPQEATLDAAVEAISEARREERIIEDLSKLLPDCEDIERLPRWWRQCVRYLTMFELIKVHDEMDIEAFEVKCNKHMQQRIGACIFSKLKSEAQHCVEMCINQSPGSTFSIGDIGTAIIRATKTHARPAPLEQKVSKDQANANMFFIMDAWDASSKVMVLGDPVNTTLNFLQVYERYLECPALLVFYCQVLRDCSVAAANLFLQDKFMEGEMPHITDVGKYITDTVLPLLRVTKAQWSAVDQQKEDQGVRNLHWSRAKRCFGCGSDAHALTNCTVVPPHCTVAELEKIRADAVVPEGYKWRAAKTVLKMHKYSAVSKSRTEKNESSETSDPSDPDDTFLVDED